MKMDCFRIFCSEQSNDSVPRREEEIFHREGREGRKEIPIAFSSFAFFAPLAVRMYFFPHKSSQTRTWLGSLNSFE
jgi:hypothetical protein